MAPITYAPEEKPPEEINEKKRKAQELERLRQLENRRHNPFVSPTPREKAQVTGPREQQTERRVQEPITPPTLTPRPAARENSNPQPAASEPVEQRQTKETTKVERVVLTHFNEEAGRYEAQEGQNKVTYQELDRIERIEPNAAQELESEKEKERLQPQIEKPDAEKIKAAPLEQIIRPVSPDELLTKEKPEEKELPKEREFAEKDAKIVADSKFAGPKEESEDEAAARIKHALDEAHGNNRPGLVVQALLDRREAQGPLDLLQFDERSVRLLQNELETRIGRAKKEREKLLLRIKGEKNADKKRALRASLKKILLNLAFYSKVKGMLSRVLGGFFAKLAGGMMKK